MSRKPWRQRAAIIETRARNPYRELIQPSQRLLAQARADGIDSSNLAAVRRWITKRREAKQ